jgi:hypothetical protein
MASTVSRNVPLDHTPRMKRLFSIAAVAVSLPFLLLALLGLRASYGTSADFPDAGSWTVIQRTNSYISLVINHNGWVTVHRDYRREAVPDTTLFAFPWWGLIALSLIAPLMFVIQVVNRKSRLLDSRRF